MTRATYLRKLKKELSGLSDSDINDTIAYYASFFEETNDDEKVINELGSPEELAERVKEKHNKNLIASQKEEKDNNSDDCVNALYYEFEPNRIQSMQLHFSAAEIVVIEGDKISFETRGIEKSDFVCNLSSNGILSVNNQKRINLEFFNHNRKYRVVPRILITLPKALSLDYFNLKIEAGSFTSEKVDITSFKSEFIVGAGNLVLKNIQSSASNIRCGMGNLELKGKLTGNINLDCGMGNLKMDLAASAEDYSFDAKIGLGDLTFNGEKKSSVAGHIDCNQKKANHISVNVGMGSVNIRFQS